MDEKNPLQTYPTAALGNNGEDLNKGGRPAMNNVIKFGPQPRSIIAQMLSDMKAKTNTGSNFTGGLTIIEDEPTGQSKLSQDDVQANKSEESWSGAEHKKTEHQSLNQKLLCDFPKCQYSCKLASNLIKHRRVHTNEKPYLCDRCSFRTNFVNSLKAHKRIHTAEKPYRCEHCNYRCNSSSNLKKHCSLRHSYKETT